MVDVPHKIVFVHHGSVLGGAPVSLSLMVNELKDAMPSTQMSVWCVAEPIRSLFHERCGVETKKIPNPGLLLGRVLIWPVFLLEGQKALTAMKELLLSPLRIWQQWSLFRQEKPDAVHLNSAILFSTALAARLAGITVIWHIREILDGNILKKKMTGSLIRCLADQVVAISPEVAEALGPDDKGNVHIVYNPMNADELKAGRINQKEARQKLGIAEDKFVALSLGGVSPWKGTAQILEAAQILGDDVCVLFAGPPFPDTEEQLSLSSTLLLKAEDILLGMGLQSHPVMRYADRCRRLLKKTPPKVVQHQGYVKDVGLLLAAADVLVFAGMAPHFPRPVFEAWLMERPVIVFDTNGISELITEGEDGFIVPHKTGKELALSIEKMQKLSEQERQEMGKAGLSAYRERQKKSVSIQSVFSF